MGNILDYEKTDLVVLNGDLINGDDTFAENSTHYIDRIVEPIVKRRLTWASAYGNHDHQLNLSAAGVFEREHIWHGARTRWMVRDQDAGVTNYFLPVYPADCNQTGGQRSPAKQPQADTEIKNNTHCIPELLLWFFDSRGGYYHNSIHKTRTHQPNWVHDSVTEWFIAKNTELVKQFQRTIPSLAFVHIPTKATDDVHDKRSPSKNPGIDEEPVSMQGKGWCPDGRFGGPDCPYSNYDASFMEALSNTEMLLGLFYGHDHANTWCYKWNATMPGENRGKGRINLCYGQHTGYAGYGDWIRGAREISLSIAELREGIFHSHIRLEDGSVVGSVTLNSTFNDDEYPITPNQKTFLNQE